LLALVAAECQKSSWWWRVISASTPVPAFPPRLSGSSLDSHNLEGFPRFSPRGSCRIRQFETLLDHGVGHDVEDRSHVRVLWITELLVGRCQSKILNTWSGHRTAQIDPEKCGKINGREIRF
jgi:hypothetical protein